MSLEKLVYEKDWDVCLRCHTRRPMRELKAVQDDWVCQDQVWCNKQVLAHEELEAQKRVAQTLTAPPKLEKKSRQK